MNTTMFGRWGSWRRRSGLYGQRLPREAAIATAATTLVRAHRIRIEVSFARS